MGVLNSIGNFLFGDNSQRNAALNEQNFRMQDGNELRGYAERQLSGAQDRAANQANAAQLGQASYLAPGQQDQWRQQQLALANQMAGVAGGQQAGAGELALRRQANMQAAQIAGQAGMARGSNSALAARAGASALGDLGINTAGAAAQSALQDQANARGQLAGLLGQGRGADIDIAGQNAQLQQQRMLQQGAFQQQANLANLQAQLQQRGMNDQYSLGMLGAAAGISEAELRARMARAGMFQEDRGAFGDLLQAGGTVLASKPWK